MNEYIERAAVLNLLEKINPVDFGSMFNYESHGAVRECLCEARYGVEDIPSADVVEVTFCKDCRYYPDAKVNEKGFLICPASSMEITKTDFCSYGQRKIETVLPKSDAKDESLEDDHE